MFKNVPNTVDFVAQEHQVLDFWRTNDVFHKLKKLRENSPRWSFIDGPITANNPMGAHHAWGRTYKDLYHRFKAMQGYQTRYQNGFDCQGLWIEVNVERDMGFQNKKDIEAYGLAEFVNACKRQVLRYAAVQTEQSIRLGYWMDWNDPEQLRDLEAKMAENPSQVITVEGPNGPVTDTAEQIAGRLGMPELGGSYFTFANENNYTIWAMLKKCFDRGWIYKGTDVMPWCSRCDTGISQHEIVTDGYRNLTHTSIFLRFPLRNRPGESLLVWTTTPWTLTSNVAAAVHPELTYVLVEQNGQRFWLSKGALENVIRGAYQVLDEKLGADLDGWTYDGPFDELPVQQTSGAVEQHRVILWDEVGEAEGTGIVHTAPGCGAEDFQLSKEHGLAVIAPLGAEGIYDEGFEWLTGRNVHTVAEEIFENLEGKGVVYRLEEYTHRYPVCWRCHEELVFRLVDEWYISMGEQLDKPYKVVTEEEKENNLRYQMMEVVQNETNWYPSFGLARELDWLRNMHDWMISKKRYWGLALPIYECHECDSFHVVGSLEELKKLAVEGWDEFEGHTPHRPWIDAVKIACPGCSAPVSRIADVGNPWLDAGSVSLSTLQYRNNRDYWKQWFPADLISESFPGQFRNWFYSLIAMSTVMERQAPFKHVFTYATLLAEDGRAMHKSWGNAIWFDDAAETMGVDVMRWMYCVAKPELNLRFGYKHADEVRRQMLIPFWNVYSFLVTYANVDEWKPETELWTGKTQDSEEVPENLLDRWILSRLQAAIRDVTDRLEGFEPDGACRVVERLLDDLSNWYLRRSRRRFWKSEADADKQSAYSTLYKVVVTTSRLLAPFIPFVTELVYRNLVCLTDPNAPQSVHLSDYPVADTDMIDDQLEADMALARDLIVLGRAARNRSAIKTRQPLGSITLGGLSGKQQTAVDRLSDLVLNELNVKTIDFGDQIEAFATFTIKPNFKQLGPKYGKAVQAIAKTVAAVDALDLKRDLDANGELQIEVDGSTYTLNREEVDVQSQNREGYTVEADTQKFVALSTELTHELILEGFARELVNRIQQMRKEANFNVSDRITLNLQSTQVVHEAFSAHRDYITHETLTTTVVEAPGDNTFVKSQKINGEAATIGVEQVRE